MHAFLVLQLTLACLTTCLPPADLRPVSRSPHLQEVSKRQTSPEDMADLALTILGIYLEMAGVQAGSDILTAEANALEKAMGAYDGMPFDASSGNCVMHIQSWGGGHCQVITTPAKKSGNSTVTHHEDGKDPWNVCWWDLNSKLSGKQYFNDPGVGNYMIEWMAKDSTISANAGGHNSPCPSLGLCNPKITFFRDKYNIALYPWESVYQGNDYKGQHPGLCKGGVLDQFHKGGMVMGYTCGVPCWNDAAPPANEIS